MQTTQLDAPANQREVNHPSDLDKWATLFSFITADLLPLLLIYSMVNQIITNSNLDVQSYKDENADIKAYDKAAYPDGKSMSEEDATIDANKQAYNNHAYQQTQDPMTQVISLAWWMTGFAIASVTARSFSHVMAQVHGYYDWTKPYSQEQLKALIKADAHDAQDKYNRMLGNADQALSENLDAVASKKPEDFMPERKVLNGHYLQKTNPDRDFENESMYWLLFTLPGYLKSANAEKLYQALAAGLLLYLGMQAWLSQNVAQTTQDAVNDVFPELWAAAMKGCSNETAAQQYCADTVYGQAMQQGTKKAMDEMGQDWVQPISYAAPAIFLAVVVFGIAWQLVADACRKQPVDEQTPDHEYSAGAADGSESDAEQGSVHSAEMVEGAVLTDSQMEANVEFSRQERSLCGCLRGNKSTHFRRAHDSAVAPLLGHGISPRSSTGSS